MRCVCYLGNGSGAAPPSVKHHGILMAFLQHFILHEIYTKSFFINTDHSLGTFTYLKIQNFINELQLNSKF